jgi:hypothetical protein
MQTLLFSATSRYTLAPTRDVGAFRAMLAKCVGKHKRATLRDTRTKSDFPIFNPGMSTAEYVHAYRGGSVPLKTWQWEQLNDTPCTLYTGADSHEELPDGFATWEEFDAAQAIESAPVDAAMVAQDSAAANDPEMPDPAPSAPAAAASPEFESRVSDALLARFGTSARESCAHLASYPEEIERIEHAARANDAAAPIRSAWNDAPMSADDDAAEIARIAALWRDKPGAAAALRARAANMRADVARAAAFPGRDTAAADAHLMQRAAIYCAAADAIDAAPIEPAPAAAPVARVSREEFDRATASAADTLARLTALFPHDSARSRLIDGGRYGAMGARSGIVAELTRLAECTHWHGRSDARAALAELSAADGAASAEPAPVAAPMAPPDYAFPDPLATHSQAAPEDDGGERWASVDDAPGIDADTAQALACAPPATQSGLTGRESEPGRLADVMRAKIGANPTAAALVDAAAELEKRAARLNLIRGDEYRAAAAILRADAAECTAGIGAEPATQPGTAEHYLAGAARAELIGNHRRAEVLRELAAEVSAPATHSAPVPTGAPLPAESPAPADDGGFSRRVATAAAWIGSGRKTSRAFDSCFEMNDGDAVGAALLRRAEKRPGTKLAANIWRFLDRVHVEESAARRPAGMSLPEWSRALIAEHAPKSDAAPVPAEPAPLPGESEPAARVFSVIVARPEKRPLQYAPVGGETALANMRKMSARGFECIAKTTANGIAEELTFDEMATLYAAPVPGDARPGRVNLILHNVLAPLQNAAPDGVPTVAGLESEAARIESAAESMCEGPFADDGKHACAVRTRLEYLDVARSLRELADVERARQAPADETAPVPLDGLEVAELGADGMAEFERAGGIPWPAPIARTYSPEPRLRIPADDPRVRIPARFTPVYLLQA